MAQRVKHLPAMWETQVGKTPWRKKWQPTPVLLPGKFLGQRSLVGYSPWDHHESHMTEQLHFKKMKYSILACFSLFMYVCMPVYIYICVYLNKLEADLCSLVLHVLLNIIISKLYFHPLTVSWKHDESESVICSVLSNSLWPHGL